MASSSVSDTTVYQVASAAPNSTCWVPVKPVPVMVTGVPPATGPDDGLTDVTVGPPPVPDW